MTEVIFVVLFIGTMLFVGTAISRVDASKREKEREEEAFRMFVKEEQQEAIKKLVQAHISTLYAKKRQTVKTDAYGNMFLDAWKKETAHFHNFVVVPKLHLRTPTNKKAPKHQIDSYLRQLEETRAIIEYAINSFATSRPARNFDVDKLTPTEFEAFCAQRLREDSWSVQTTKSSGDQGIDIIGEKNGWKAVFQVKKYASPVGNKAVQEVIAGRAFASADLAFVISNASFTPSAIQLAQTADVRLLHHTQLTGLAKWFT